MKIRRAESLTDPSCPVFRSNGKSISKSLIEELSLSRSTETKPQTNQAGNCETETCDRKDAYVLDSQMNDTIDTKLENSESAQSDSFFVETMEQRKSDDRSSKSPLETSTPNCAFHLFISYDLTY